MPRCNGSYIGIDANPNANVASGIWTVREAETLLRANQWPATPTVPSAPTGTAGDEQVALTWTAPTGGSTPTDYEVQYSSNGGSTWTTFSDGVSSATSAIVTGLTNGTGYIFRVKAVNILGDGPYGSASGTVTPAALNVALLLHFDGTNGSTTFTDSSQNALTVTANGDAEISTAQSKWGGASGYFDGDGDYIDIGQNGDFLYGANGDFTIECWVRPSSFSGQAVFGTRPEGSYNDDCLVLAVDGSGFPFLHTNTTAMVNSGTSIPLDEWSHLAAVRSGDVFSLYVNGMTVGSHTGAYTLDATENAIVGGEPRTSANAKFHGYIDDLRIVKGVAVYTGNFTPPTSPF